MEKSRPVTDNLYNVQITQGFPHYVAFSFLFYRVQTLINILTCKLINRYELCHPGIWSTPTLSSVQSICHSCDKPRTCSGPKQLYQLCCNFSRWSGVYSHQPSAYRLWPCHNGKTMKCSFSGANKYSIVSPLKLLWPVLFHFKIDSMTVTENLYNYYKQVGYTCINKIKSYFKY